jgi:hypothetical protein
LNAAAYQLNGIRPLDGTFVYSPAVGTVFMAGAKQLSVTFTPNDTANYTSATKLVPLTVSQSTLTVSANSYTRLYGAANPAFQGNIAGFQNGDTFAKRSIAPRIFHRIQGNILLFPLHTEPISRTTSSWYKTER